MPVTHIGPDYPFDQTDPSEVRKRIAQYKRKLERRAKRNGMYENFGNKEIRALNDEFGTIQSDARIRRMMESFYNWCMNYVPPRE